MGCGVDDRVASGFQGRFKAKIFTCYFAFVHHFRRWCVSIRSGLLFYCFGVKNSSIFDQFKERKHPSQTTILKWTSFGHFGHILRGIPIHCAAWIWLVGWWWLTLHAPNFSRASGQIGTSSAWRPMLGLQELISKVIFRYLLIKTAKLFQQANLKKYLWSLVILQRVFWRAKFI